MFWCLLLRLQAKSALFVKWDSDGKAKTAADANARHKVMFDVFSDAGKLSSNFKEGVSASNKDRARRKALDVKHARRAEAKGQKPPPRASTTRSTGGAGGSKERDDATDEIFESDIVNKVRLPRRADLSVHACVRARPNERGWYGFA